MRTKRCFPDPQETIVGGAGVVREWGGLFMDDFALIFRLGYVLQ